MCLNNLNLFISDFPLIRRLILTPSIVITSSYAIYKSLNKMLLSYPLIYST
jgi:hypothetical protein